jgi:hypothetical protein
MHPYRSLAPIAGPAAQGGRTTGVDFAGSILLSVGGLVTLAGLFFADGTEFAVGVLMVMAAVRRAATRIPRERAALN